MKRKSKRSSNSKYALLEEVQILSTKAVVIGHSNMQGILRCHIQGVSSFIIKTSVKNGLYKNT